MAHLFAVARFLGTSLFARSQLAVGSFGLLEQHADACPFDADSIRVFSGSGFSRLAVGPSQKLFPFDEYLKPND